MNNNKFCLKWYNNNPYIGDCGEVIIKWHRSNNLLNFIKDRPEQRIIIDIEDAKEFIWAGGPQYFDLLAHDYEVTNWALRLPSMFSEKTFSKDNVDKYFIQKHIPFFFNDYISSYDVLAGMINYGVSDVYVANELGFDLKKIHEVTKNKNVKLRVIPNIAQSLWWDNPSITDFWIRPEDAIPVYEEYVDVFELASLEDGYKDSAIYKAYAIDQKWYGNLSEIIQGLTTEVDSKFLHPRWAETRVGCHKRCLNGGACRMCYTLTELGDTLKKAGVTVTRPEPEVDETDLEKIEEKINNYYDMRNDPQKAQDFISEAVKKLDNR